MISKGLISSLQYRNHRANNRSGRSQVDHDVLEGWPVRHWRKTPVAVNSAPPKDESVATTSRKAAWPELPMPRDYHLLSEMSQALLRAARSGETIKKPGLQPLTDDERDNADEDEAEDDIDLGFVAKRWAPIPRHSEEPEPEYLAKRRSGLQSAYNGVLGQNAATSQMRKTKVRKVDADGNISVLDILVPEGQSVDGEILEDQHILTEASVHGTEVEAVGMINVERPTIARDPIIPTPPRRRPPPPRRKPKGPGRGRKKKVAFALGTEGSDKGPMQSEPSSGTNTAPVGAIEQQNQSQHDEDVEMEDDATMQIEEHSTGDEEDGEGEEEGDRDEEELSPLPDSFPSPGKQTSPSPSPKTQDKDGTSPEPNLEVSAMDKNGVLQRVMDTVNQPSSPKDLSSSPEFPLAASQNGRVTAPDHQVQPISDQADDKSHAHIDTDNEAELAQPLDMNDTSPDNKTVARETSSVGKQALPTFEERLQQSSEPSRKKSNRRPHPEPEGHSPQISEEQLSEVSKERSPEVIDEYSQEQTVQTSKGESLNIYQGQSAPGNDNYNSSSITHYSVDGLYPPTPEAFTPKDEYEVTEMETEPAEVSESDQVQQEVDLLGSLERHLEGKALESDEG